MNQPDTMLWQILNSAAVVALFIAAIRFVQQFTTHGNKIASLEDQAVKFAKQDAQFLDMYRESINDRNAIRVAMATLTATHNGFEAWLARIEGKIDMLDKRLAEHQRDERKNG